MNYRTSHVIKWTSKDIKEIWFNNHTKLLFIIKRTDKLWTKIE